MMVARLKSLTLSAVRRCLVTALLPIFVAGGSYASTTFIDFEQFNDSDQITNQILGITFTNTVVLTAGFSLNEFDFPPRSGVNVAFDSGGPMSIAFGTPVSMFAAYFTYLQPLTLLAFDVSNVQIGKALSLFSNNTGTAGDPGSSPNERLQLSFAGGIGSVSITGAPAGGSFVMDDVTLVPEPGTLPVTFVAIGMAGLFLRRRFTS